MQGPTPVEALTITDLKALVDRIFTEGHLSYDDRQCLKSLLLDELIGDDELTLIEQVITAIRKGEVCIS